VTIGSVVLTPDANGRYTTLSSQFGGGAVGVCKFGLHGEDCLPVDGGNHSANPTSVTLKFYGPVTWNSGFPFMIEFFNGTNWVSAGPWIMYYDWNGLTGKGTRTIILIYDGDPAVIPSGDYRITPILTGSNALLCDDLLTTSDVTAETFEYNFTVP
jgi:hypothetical protein